MAKSAAGTAVSTEELQNALKDEKYPKEKDMIIEDLKEWGADQRVIDAISKLESREYVSFHDLKDSLDEYNKHSTK